MSNHLEFMIKLNSFRLTLSARFKQYKPVEYNRVCRQDAKEPIARLRFYLFVNIIIHSNS